MMDQKKIKSNNKQLRTLVSILKLVILAGIVIIMPLYVYFQYPELIDHFRSLDRINAFLNQYKTVSVLIYIGLQIFQIVVSVLPGQALQFAAGYAYHFWFGYLFSIIGVTIGTLVTFYLARLLGKDALHVIFGEEKFTKFVHTLNSKKSYFILFVIFLIPGIPKDLFTYAAGVSEVKIKPFLLLSLVGRTPAMMGSVMMGSMFFNGSYIGLIILCVIAVILFIAGLLRKDDLIKWTDRYYNKLVK